MNFTEDSLNGFKLEDLKALCQKHNVLVVRALDNHRNSQRGNIETNNPNNNTRNQHNSSNSNPRNYLRNDQSNNQTNNPSNNMDIDNQLSNQQIFTHIQQLQNQINLLQQNRVPQIFEISAQPQANVTFSAHFQARQHQTQQQQTQQQPSFSSLLLPAASFQSQQQQLPFTQAITTPTAPVAPVASPAHFANTKQAQQGNFSTEQVRDFFTHAIKASTEVKNVEQISKELNAGM